MAVPAYADPAVVLARLRMKADAADAPWVALCTDAANELVDNWLQANVDDPPLVAPFPSLIQRAAVGVAIRIYRFQDTAANVDEGWGPEGVSVSLPRDPLAGYVDMLGVFRSGAAWSPQ